MRVTLVGPSAQTYKGGIAQFTSILCDKLKAGRCQVYFASWSRMYPPIIKRDFHDNASKKQIGACDARFELDYMNPFTWLRFAWRQRHLACERMIFTWIHPVHAPVYIVIFSCIRLFSSTRISLLCHNVLPHEPFPGQKILTKIVLNLVDDVIVHGSSEAERVRELHENKEVIKLFLPIHDFFGDVCEEKSISSRAEINLVFFGNIRPYKGLDLLLQAVRILVEEGVSVSLTVAGELFEAYSDDLVQQITDLAISDYVHLNLGYVSNEQVASVFSDKDVAVFPYRSATQSGSLTVAYSFGVPVISTSVGSLPDVVSEGRSGYLCNPDPRSIADCVKRYKEFPISRESVLKYAHSELGWDAYVDGVLKRDVD